MQRALSSWSGFGYWVAVGVLAVACDDKPKAPDQRTSTPPPTSAREAVSPKSTAKPSGKSALKLKLATWNLEWLDADDGHGNVARQPADYARLARYAEQLDADVVALQEVDGPEAAQRVFDPARYDFHFIEGHNPQRTGFAYARSLRVTPNADYRALGLDGLRSSADLTIWLQSDGVADAVPLRLLSVHLKSGCFEAPLDGPGKACTKLRRQLPHLEAWIDARAAEGVPFAVLGDFNRRLFKRPDDAFWIEIDDAEPQQADLDSPTRGQLSRCWGQRHPHFIDHLVLSRAANTWLQGGLIQLVYDAADAPHAEVLSDHCALAAVLAPTRAQLQGALTRVAHGVSTPPTPPATEPIPPRLRAGPIKGNINSQGAKLYHDPGCPNYERVKLDLAKGERLFETEAEAKAAGWTRSPDCP
jgi:endonuclease/exonuclease/phosphatase family metal-dependent hydrolase